jgi:putative ABC transport system permease protein
MSWLSNGVPNWLSKVIRKFVATLRPEPLETELDEELRFHLEQRTEDLIANGTPPREARREAAMLFGNRAAMQDSTRDRDTLVWLATTLQDLRFALRTLSRARTFTAVSILTLSLGIGAVTAIFTVVNGVILRPLPYNDPDRLMTVWEANPNYPTGGVRFSPGNYLDLRAQNRSFRQVGAFATDNYNLTGSGDAARVSGGQVSASFFPMLGIAPILGRNFDESEDRWDAPHTVILSYSFWQQRFGGNSRILGTGIRLDDKLCTVIGVMPPGLPVLPAAYEGPDGIDLWLPIENRHDAETMHWRFSYYVAVIARLKPGVTARQAQQDVDGIVKLIQKQWPDDLGKGGLVVPLHERTVGPVRRPLLILLGAVAFVLLIACANLANLNLGHAVARRREIAVRLALGAGRGRVTRQLLTESLMVALAGAALGLGLARWGAGALLRLAPAELPRTQDVAIDPWVLGFTVAVSVVSAVLFGLFPAWSAAGAGVQEGLREAGRASSAGPRGQRLRSGLVVAEIALAVILLVGAGLMIESFLRVRNGSAGFRAEGLIAMRVPLSETAYQGIARQTRFYGSLFEKVRAIPGVASFGAIDGLPFSAGGFDNTFEIMGRPPQPPGHALVSDIRRTDPGYFRTMQIPLLRGREFGPADRTDTTGVALINQSMADRYFPREDPVGKSLHVMFGNPSVFATIVGVVGDVRNALDAAPRDTIYLPYPQGRHVTSMYLVIRLAGDVPAATLVTRVRAAVNSIDAGLPVYRVTTMDELMAASVATRRFQMLLLSMFALVAMTLAAMGLYGVLSYAVQARTREIGIRSALGARAAQIFGMVIGDAVRLAAVGVAAGLAGALALTRTLAVLLYEVKPSDPAPYLAMPVLLLLIGLPAAWLPARRAARVQPVVALRSE